MSKVCVKVSNLRILGYFSMREWLEDKQNIYVGRRGRIWITEKDGSKTLFFYSQSKWHNPYKVSKEMSLEKSLELYEKHIVDNNLINDILELEGLNLGCFCENGSPCHADVLLKYIIN